MRETTAKARWDSLSAIRSGFISRCELYAAYTVRKLCLPAGYDQNSAELSRDYNSLGAQLVNHLANRIMLSLFAPSRPFFRYDITAEAMEEFTRQTGTTEQSLQESLSVQEKKAIKVLDKIAARPKLYEVLRHLITTGNVLLYLHPKEDRVRCIGIKNYVVKRNAEGKVLEIIIKEDIKKDELDEGLYKYAPGDDDSLVEYFRWIRWDASKKKYIERYWVDQLIVQESEYIGMYKESALPYLALTWDLSDDSDYGTGLVEEYEADFVALSQLSQAELNGAILASEFRWLANPMGITSPKDLNDSENGEVIPGQEGDISLISAGNVAQNIAVVSAAAETRIRRLGQGFLLGSAVTRDAERVTAEEFRYQAAELDSSLGGVYSRMGVELQAPLATWLTRRTGFKIDGTDVEPVVITGMDALSRNADLENVRLYIADIAQVTSLPEASLRWLKLGNIFSLLATGRSLKATDMVYSEDEVKQAMQAEQDALNQQTITQAGAQAGAKAAVQQG